MKRLVIAMLLISIMVGLLPGMNLSGVAADNSEAIIDYSDLTTNQYLAKIFTNYNYCGSLNKWGKETNYPPYALMEEFYLDAAHASKARIVFNEFNEATDYKTTHGLYELLTFSGSSAVEKVMELEDYYTAILLSILDTQLADDNWFDDLNCKTNKTILTLSKNISKYLESTAKFEHADNLEMIRTQDLDDETLWAIANILAADENSQKLWKLVGKDIGVISTVMSAGSTVNDAVKNIGDFSQLANFSAATEEVLHQIYLNCPDDNLPMKNAARKVYEYVSGQMSYEIMALSKAGYAAFKYALSEIVGDLWKACLTAIFGELTAGVLIGQAVGKLIANYCFATDAIHEQLCTISALVDFEDVMVASVRSLENIYKSDESAENSDNYVESLHFLMSTYDLGCEYVEDFVEAVYRKGAINDMIYNNSDEYNSWMELFANQKAINKQRDSFLYLEKYKVFYKVDAPSAYEGYFGKPEDKVEIIPIASMNVTQKKGLFAGDEGASYDFFSITYSPENHTEIMLGETVTSSNENVIKVDDRGWYIGGYIYAVKEGTCTLTFTTPDLKHSASIEVTVKKGTNQGDSGDFEGYIPISTKEDLDNIRNNLSGKYYLTRDIEFDESDFAVGGAFYNNGVGWLPIGSDSINAFSGVFDGNNHTIKGLIINLPSNMFDYMGLFGYNEGTILNLGMINGSILPVITSSNVYTYIGGLAGYNDKNGIIRNCNYSNCVSVNSSTYVSANVGGIVGYNEGTISNCNNTGTMTFTLDASRNYIYAGGIAGHNYGAVDNCFNSSQIIVNSSIIDYKYKQAVVGGIIGRNYGTINSCHNIGDIINKAYDADVGGIASTNYGTISNCYNTGDIRADSTSYTVTAGGIVGRNYSTIGTGTIGAIINCYNIGNISAVCPFYFSDAGGIAGSSSGGMMTTLISSCYYLNNINTGVGMDYEEVFETISCTDDEMRCQSTFVGFDFDTIWKMGCGDYLYPILVFEAYNSEKKELYDANSGIVVSDEDTFAIPENAELQVINTETSEDRMVYNIMLKINGQEVQLNGTVTVKIPVPDTMDGTKCKVYRVETNGISTDMGAQYLDGYLVFETSHFSEYVITVPHEHTYDFSTWESDRNSHWRECTICGGIGEIAAHIPGADATETTNQFCTVCGYILKSAPGHLCVNHLTWISAKEATCTKAGNIAYYRCECGKLYKDAGATDELGADDVIIPALGHSYGAWKETKATTCTEKGSEDRICSACGDTQMREIPALGHDYKNGVCTRCGEKDPNHTETPDNPETPDDPETPTRLLGDINEDGKIDAVDYMLLKRYVLGTYGIADEKKVVADVNKDGQINAVDYMLLKRHVLGTYKIA